MVGRYEIPMSLCFEVRRKRGQLSPATVNPALAEFRDLLCKAKIIDGSLRAYPAVVDEFRLEERADRLLGSYELKWEVSDMDAAGRADRFNNRIRPLLAQEVRKIVLEGNKSIAIRIIDTCFQGEVKHGDSWPRENVVAVVA